MNDTPTAGQLSAARRDYTGTGADLEAILEEWDVHIVDEVDDNPERNPHVGFVPAEGTSLVDALEAWRDAAVRTALPGQLVVPGNSEYPGASGAVWHDADGEAGCCATTAECVCVTAGRASIPAKSLGSTGR